MLVEDVEMNLSEMEIPYQRFKCYKSKVGGEFNPLEAFKVGKIVVLKDVRLCGEKNQWHPDQYDVLIPNDESLYFGSEYKNVYSFQ